MVIVKILFSGSLKPSPVQIGVVQGLTNVGNPSDTVLGKQERSMGSLQGLHTLGSIHDG
jgi:hypothetical protein